MTINNFDFPIYDILLYLSLIIGAIYIYVSLNKENISKKNIIIFFILFIFLALFFGKLYTFIEFKGKVNLLKSGPTGYGGLIGVILAGFISDKINKNTQFTKYAIISLPLMYGFAKLACFFQGCCIGIPYNGPLAVTYPNSLNTPLFPVQLLETIVFIIIFLVCNSLNKKKNIIYITLSLVFIFKFLLDFLRYVHLESTITNNQIVSIVLFIITIIIYFIKRKKASNN